MEDVLAVAKALNNLYIQSFGQSMDEMKMHKLMYFAQRESLIVDNMPLFNDEFKGWKYGPVLKKIRYEFRKNNPFEKVLDNVSPNTLNILKQVIKRYGNISSWTLSAITHDEFSWKFSREGIKSGVNGDVSIPLDAIMVDVIRERNARNNIPQT